MVSERNPGFFVKAREGKKDGSHSGAFSAMHINHVNLKLNLNFDAIENFSVRHLIIHLKIKVLDQM